MSQPAFPVVAGALQWEHVLIWKCCCAQLSDGPFRYYYLTHVEHAQLTGTLKDSHSKHTLSGAQSATAPKFLLCLNEFPLCLQRCSGNSSVEISDLGCIHTKSRKYARCSKMYEHLTPYSYIQMWRDLVFLTNNHHNFNLVLHRFFFCFF